MRLIFTPVRASSITCVILCLLFLTAVAPACEKSYPDKPAAQPTPPDADISPGDSIAGIMEPASQPPRKVRISGVIKNAVALEAGRPIRITVPGEGRLGFAAGVIAGASPGRVELVIRQGRTVLERLAIEQGSGWRQVEVSLPVGSDKEITIESEMAGPGVYIAHPRFLAGNVRPRLVVFFLVDDLRADALGVYGAEGDPSPAIDRLAAEGAVFERAYTAAPFTLTSVASIFTGLFPWQHRVIFSKDGGLTLPASMPLLIESFRRAGCHTAAISGTWFHLSANGFARGFDTMDEKCAPAFFRESASCMNRRITAFLDEHKDEPVFLYVHYVDTHAPYFAPAPFTHRFTSGLATPAQADVARGEVDQFGSNRGWRQFFRRPEKNDVTFLRGLYQGEVSYADAKIGEILKDLPAGADSLVVLAADHGEAFYEHGWFEHVSDLHQPVMRVPLIFRGAVVPPGLRVKAEARTIDILPTLLDLCGLRPPQNIPGRSLVPLMRGEKLLPAPDIAIRFPDNGTEYAMVLWPWKIFFRPKKNQLELYRLDDDPGEQNDLAAKLPEQAAALQSLLESQLQPGPPSQNAPAPPIDDETRKRLDALGY